LFLYIYTLYVYFTNPILI